MIDVFYSLVGVHQRFDRLALDSLYIHHLDFVMKPLFDRNSPVDNQLLDRIYTKILPRIHHKVNKLTLEPLSIECVLNTVHYPQLHSISFVNFHYETLLRHLQGDTIVRLLTDQITHLDIYICEKTTEMSEKNELSILVFILSMGKHLNDLIYNQWLSESAIRILPLNLLSKSLKSSSLTKLRIEVNAFDECLYLLDGRLECLSTLIIYICEITNSSSNTNNTKTLPKLKCFSLASNWYTYCYDNEIVSLLRRMLNLEELTLFLSVIRTESTYINGKQLNDEVLIHIPRLNKFTFNIHTHVINNNIKIDLPSNDDIRNSFIKIGYQQVDSFADDKLVNNRGNCHVYSLPYQFRNFMFMNSAFQGGGFDKVRCLIMFDRRPFEYELFKIISRDFPFLENLTLRNSEPQQNKQQQSSIFITFVHLVELDLHSIHIDYVVQFLSDRNILLPRLKNLYIDYEPLITVTNHFTNDATRLNCAKIEQLFIKEPFVRPENFQSYFPLL
ncbi:unnamed protein product [Rotaria sp. Silwood2]|nr:unnamed protein product [Rotaria sp. Silwood2]CAF4442908.1 unnamed protein product [Rotaria sp. Silwood2]